MIDSILHSHFIAGLVSGGLAVAARDLAFGLISGIGLLITTLQKHPNAYVTPSQLDQFHKDLLANIAKDAAAAAQPTQMVAVNIEPVPVPVPAQAPDDRPNIPVYNQD